MGYYDQFLVSVLRQRAELLAKLSNCTNEKLLEVIKDADQESDRADFTIGQLTVDQLADSIERVIG